MLTDSGLIQIKDSVDILQEDVANKPLVRLVLKPNDVANAYIVTIQFFPNIILWRNVKCDLGEDQLYRSLRIAGKAEGIIGDGLGPRDTCMELLRIARRYEHVGSACIDDSSVSGELERSTVDDCIVDGYFPELAVWDSVRIH